MADNTATIQPARKYGVDTGTPSDPLSRGRAALRFCNSYTRLPTLLDLYEGLEVDAAEWLTLLGEVWECCDNVSEHLERLSWTPLAEVLDGDPGYRDLLMTEAERAAFNALPDSVEVWRGCYAPNKWGLSWSLEQATAARFPTLNRYTQEGQPILVRAVANKRNIAAVKLERGEAEIITHRPRHISTRRIRAA